jgi:hypothetical protein
MPETHKDGEPMSGALPHYRLGPDSYQVSATVLGGQLVQADAGLTTVSVAGAGSTTVLGIAGTDAQPVPNQAGATDALAGNAPLLDISVVGDYTAVYCGPADIRATYAANAAFGQLLKAAAAGTVTPWVSGTDTNAALIVGRCTQPGGVTISALATGRMRLFP